MNTEDTIIARVNQLSIPSKVKDVPPDSVLVEQLLTEGIRRFYIWSKVLGGKAKYDYFYHIIDDVAKCINPNWVYTTKSDPRLRINLRLDRRDRKIIDNYVNWERNAEKIFNQYFQPNPYTPFFKLIEVGAGGIVDLEYELELNPAYKFKVGRILERLDFMEPKIVM